MEPNYKNWIPKGMVYGMAASAAALAACGVGVWMAGTRLGKTARLALHVGASIASVGCAALTAWCVMARERFSYEGDRQLSRVIVEGTAKRVSVPAGGTCLDVGCGSGALAIAVAKRNPNARVVGIDLWGPEYASFSQELCEHNAEAEGVGNVSFEPGDARRLPFADETFDAVTSNYVYHNIVGLDKQGLLLETLRVLKKGGTFALHDIFSKSRYGDMQAFVEKLRRRGYERVELVDTTDGMFMTRGEAAWMALSGSALLVGKK